MKNKIAFTRFLEEDALRQIIRGARNKPSCAYFFEVLSIPKFDSRYRQFGQHTRLLSSVATVASAGYQGPTVITCSRGRKRLSIPTVDQPEPLPSFHTNDW